MIALPNAIGVSLWTTPQAQAESREGGICKRSRVESLLLSIGRAFVQRFTRIIFAATLLLYGSYVGDALAQQTLPSGNPTAAKPSAEVKLEKDALGRTTPQGMVAGLMKALASGNYVSAAHYFQSERVWDPDSGSALSGPALARTFQEVLDRAGTVITPAELSDDPRGIITDKLEENFERFGSLKFAEREAPLLAIRVKRDDKLLWLVSDKTLNEVPAYERLLAGDASTRQLIDWLPPGLRVFGAPLSHWLMLLVTAGFSFVLAWGLIALRRPIGRYVVSIRGSRQLLRLIEVTAAPLRLLIAVLVFQAVVQAPGLSAIARYKFLFIATVLGWFAFAWLLWKSADAAVEFIDERISRRSGLLAQATVSFFNRVLKGLLGLVFIVVLFRAFGVDVTAGLAALGIGGIAIALGAQKLLENLIGSLTLLADRPMAVGDFCRVGSTLGAIEEIGIRSTRIRTLDRTLLTVPNGNLSSQSIENYSARDRFWFHPTLNLRYETSADQMRYALQALRSMLTEHPNVDSATVRVRLIGLAAYSLDVELFAYVLVSDYSEFLEVQESLLLKCMDIVADSGTAFAFPSQTLYLGRDTDINNSRAREANELVRRQSTSLDMSRRRL